MKRSQRMAKGGEVKKESKVLTPQQVNGASLKDIEPHMSKYAEGGEVHEEDMIARLMHKHMMSKGGMIANDDEPIADEEPAQYDDLALDDHLSEHYTEENSGDEVGDEDQDARDADLISKIMKSRAKKDRLPRPA